MSSADETRQLAVLPIKNTVLFPYLLLPLSVGRERSLAAVEAVASSEDKTLFVVAQKDARVDDASFDQLYTVGTEAVIRRMERGDNVIQMIVQGTRRMELIEPGQTAPYLQARVRALPEPTDTGTEIDALSRALADLAGRIQALAQPETPANITQILAQFKDPLHQAYLLASMLSLDLEKEQQLLESNTRLEALRLVHEFMTHEVQIAELRQKI
ncbi:MAG TPA: LON peptidase substrate-binding domain-containing protein, partial [Pirellulales bacterium]|nr:LON peptidase substrate-binding domain-containing protein [Pirellulales bacterium]